MSRLAVVGGALLISATILAGCRTPKPVPDDSQSVQAATDAYLAYERGDCNDVALWTEQNAVESWEAGEIRHSMLLIHGFCQELLGNRRDAIETYRRLVRDAPLSFASDDARERIRILRLTERDPEYQAWVDAARERVSEGRSARVPVDRVPADFPPLARKAAIEGYAIVEFGVTPNGNTDAPVVVDSHPPFLFDGAALRAVREWRYTRDPHGAENQRQVIRIVFQPVPNEPEIPLEDSSSADGETARTLP